MLLKLPEKKKETTKQKIEEPDWKYELRKKLFAKHYDEVMKNQ